MAVLRWLSTHQQERLRAKKSDPESAGPNSRKLRGPPPAGRDPARPSWLHGTTPAKSKGAEEEPAVLRGGEFGRDLDRGRDLDLDLAEFICNLTEALEKEP